MSNLLPKKLWHVGRADNKERVILDETKAKIIDEKTSDERDRDARLARLELLRNKKAEVDGEENMGESDTFAKHRLEKQAEGETRLCMSKTLGETPWYIGGKRGSRQPDPRSFDRLDPSFRNEGKLTVDAPYVKGTFEGMRQERLRRESVERARADALLSKSRNSYF
jgi:hypothetical protein